jgi:hypothetical protein
MDSRIGGLLLGLFAERKILVGFVEDEHCARNIVAAQLVGGLPVALFVFVGAFKTHCLVGDLAGRGILFVLPDSCRNRAAPDFSFRTLGLLTHGL